MAAIHGSSISSVHHGDRASDRSAVVETRPAFKKRAGTRKRAGAVMAAALASMAQSFWGVPDQTRPRAASEARRPNHKIRQQLNSLLDQLLAGRERKLPPIIQGLHLLLGEIATVKYGATSEQSARPFIDAYFRGGPRDELLLTNERLDVLAGAESLFATMNETNRQDVQGVMAVLKRSVLQELAAQGIGESLRLLAGRLCEDKPDIRHIAKAWFALEDGVRAAYDEGLHPIVYLQAGLDRLPVGTVRVFAAVLAPRVPSHARMARYLLERVVRETPRDSPLVASLESLEPGMVQDAVRAHIAYRLDEQVAEATRKLENAVRPGMRTAEIANRVWRDLRDTLDAVGWVYVDGVVGDDDDDAAGEAVVKAETERQFARALGDMRRRTAAACLARLDTDRLLAMYAHRGEWNETQHWHLEGLLDRARDARLGNLQGAVDASRRDVERVLAQDRRIAVAHALVSLSDALAARERFAARTGAPLASIDDTRVDATILRAASTLRLAGEPGVVLGGPSLRALGDTAFSDLRQCGDGMVFRGLSLDPAAVAEEMQRRAARYDTAVQARLDQLSDLLRGPALAPRPFMGLVAAVALSDVARRERLAAFGDGAAASGPAGWSPALRQALATVLYRNDGAMPVQWMESRRHIGGLLRALQQIRGAAGPDGPMARQADAPASPLAALDTSISLLQGLGRHFGIDALGRAGDAAAETASDPYWNDGRLVETAAFFGIRFEPSRRRAAPLLGAMHRARLLAALSLRMAQPAPASVESRRVADGGAVRDMRIDRRFYEQAYRRGAVSLSVDGAGPHAAIVASAVGAGSELGRQSASSLDGALGALSALAAETAVPLTRLMAAIGQGIDDFVASARAMPATARWLRIPEPDAVRHVHFHVSDLPRGGYRLDVAACLETSRPETEGRLAFALRIDASGHRVMSLIVPPDLRLLPAELPAARNGSTAPVTTARHVREIPKAIAGGQPAWLVAASG